MMKPNHRLPRTLILTLIIAFLPTCTLRRSSSRLEMQGSSLTIEEYALESLTCEADPEARCFIPVSGTFDEIMAVRALERSQPPGAMYSIQDGQISAPLNGDNLKVSISNTGAKDDTNIYVIVEYADGPIFSRSLGAPSPINPLQGLWVHDGHWYLEVADNVSGGNSPEASGVIVIDGEVLHESLGYEEAFGFSILSGMPFYFFSKSGVIDISLNGEVIPVGYEHIPHIGCCSAARLNPVRAENMMSFFAQRGGTWYYVEAGVYR